MSRSAFAHRFTTLVGEPPLTYQVGYTSEFAFAKAFKRQYGVAPGRYRRTATTA
jgi:YesN/AraC family two-component response regulator